MDPQSNEAESDELPTTDVQPAARRPQVAQEGYECGPA